MSDRSHSFQEQRKSTRQALALIVNGSEALCRLARIQLARLGVALQTADNEMQAVQMASRVGYQVIFLDMTWPLRDALEATCLIRQAQQAAGLPRTPVVAVTGCTRKEECLKAGFDDFLARPVTLEDLRRVLDRWLGEVARAG